MCDQPERYKLLCLARGYALFTYQRTRPRITEIVVFGTFLPVIRDYYCSIIANHNLVYTDTGNHLNGAMPDPHAPFGGYKQSGIGREWGQHGFEEFLEVKAVMGDNPQ
ncbi:MAG: aldehyde dehydrogenase family protein [Lewinella sp.]|nr:aldehyde dehydrogenase family protein [Lewinella sp.]